MRDRSLPDSALGGFNPRPVSSLLGGCDVVEPITPLRLDTTDYRLGGDPVDTTPRELGSPLPIAPVPHNPPVLFTLDYSRSQSASAAAATASSPIVTNLMPDPIMTTLDDRTDRKPIARSDPVSKPPLDLDDTIHKCVASFRLSDWAREQSGDPSCRATVSFLRRQFPDPFPDTLHTTGSCLATSKEDDLVPAQKVDLRHVSTSTRCNLSLLVKKEATPPLNGRVFVPLIVRP